MRNTHRKIIKTLTWNNFRDVQACIENPCLFLFLLNVLRHLRLRKSDSVYVIRCDLVHDTWQKWRNSLKSKEFMRQDFYSPFVSALGWLSAWEGWSNPNMGMWGGAGMPCIAPGMKPAPKYMRPGSGNPCCGARGWYGCPMETAAAAVDTCGEFGGGDLALVLLLLSLFPSPSSSWIAKGDRWWEAEVDWGPGPGTERCGWWEREVPGRPPPWGSPWRRFITDTIRRPYGFPP